MQVGELGLASAVQQAPGGIVQVTGSVLKLEPAEVLHVAGPACRPEGVIQIERLYVWGHLRLVRVAGPPARLGDGRALGSALVGRVGGVEPVEVGVDDGWGGALALVHVEVLANGVERIGAGLRLDGRPGPVDNALVIGMPQVIAAGGARTVGAVDAVAKDAARDELDVSRGRGTLDGRVRLSQ